MSSVKSFFEAEKESNSSPATASGEAFLLAHFSDPHLSSLAAVSPRDLLCKRLLGYLSWYRRRRRIHRREILDALLRDLQQVAPNHLAVTGDLIQIGLPDEFRQAARWLERVGPPQEVTVVPGNHDAYVTVPWRDGQAHWAPYLAAGDAGGMPPAYPILRVRGPLALIGLSSARPAAPLLAVGSLGHEQLERFEQLLATTRQRGLIRVVLIHHPPVPGSIAWRKRLTDARAFAEVVGRRGAELVLHGHAHYFLRHFLDGPEGAIPVLGVPSASSSEKAAERTAAYHLFRFVRQGEGWRCHLEVRAYSAEAEAFQLLREETLVLPGETPEKARSMCF